MSVYDETLHPEPLSYRVWGREHIDDQSLRQMDNAMRLPITVSGALMPDAHVGYGLPIGGVLATEGAVIPYAVGVDIACRMRISVFPQSVIVLDQQPGKFKKALTENTIFGAGGRHTGNKLAEHQVLDDDDWNSAKYVRSLHELACEQLGTSGSGNHFAEWGLFTIEDDDDELGLAAGKYLALLTHSGSRGVGFKIASHYSKLAQQMHPNLEKSVRNLAWLPMVSELGQEYWIAMELAGKFAAANHEVIHKRVSKAAGIKPLVTVENHHNFAWKMSIPVPDGSEREVIVHRKGATPAGNGALGIIPGSMADPGYLVRGKGNAESIYSAAHGAGRLMSRKQALNTLTGHERNKYINERGVTLLAAGLDEAPQAYKNINEVMEAQSDLVDIVGRFDPKIVQMDDGKKHRRPRKKDKNKRKGKRGRR